MNTQLIIPDEIKRELSVNPDGTCFISIRGLARLLEINHQSLLYHFNSGKKSPTKLAETLINQGFNMVKFSDDGIPEIAISTIIVYYSSHGNKNVKQRATDILLAYSAIGIRTWIQHELGYNQSTNQELEQLKEENTILKEAYQRVAWAEYVTPEVKDAITNCSYLIAFDKDIDKNMLGRILHFTPQHYHTIQLLTEAMLSMKLELGSGADNYRIQHILHNLFVAISVNNLPLVDEWKKAMVAMELVHNCKALAQKYYRHFTNKSLEQITEHNKATISDAICNVLGYNRPDATKLIENSDSYYLQRQSFLFPFLTDEQLSENTIYGKHYLNNPKYKYEIKTSKILTPLIPQSELTANATKALPSNKKVDTELLTKNATDYMRHKNLREEHYNHFEAEWN